MTSEEFAIKFESLSREKRIILLSLFGHALTVIGRLSYEFQKPGVSNPRMLREINELQHQTFNRQISEALGHETHTSWKEFFSQMFEENRREIRSSLSNIFAMAYERFERINCDAQE